jgi:hypothetical protein
MAKLLHVHKKLSLMLKIDITWAFDSIAWPFLLEIMHHIGFSHTSLDWTSTLLSTVSTWVSINGAQGNRIYHARGFRQGDPLSPMLFVLVMEVLEALIRKADDWALFSQVGV